MKQLGDYPMIIRGGIFNAFLFPAFAEAVKATKRPNVVIGGVTTEGCALQTTSGAVRAGYKRVHRGRRMRGLILRDA